MFTKLVNVVKANPEVVKKTLLVVGSLVGLAIIGVVIKNQADEIESLLDADPILSES